MTHPFRFRTGGFTLIELLVVVAVISVLLGLLAPVIGLARRQAKQMNTASLLRKVDAAVRLFKADVRVFPWDGCLQPRLAADGSANPAFGQSYPDPAGGPGSWSNRLLRHLGRTLDPTAAGNVLADATAAGRAFDYDRTNADGDIASDNQEVAARYGVHVFLESDRLPYGFEMKSGAWTPKQNDATTLAMILNRMAQERYGLAMLAGATAIRGPKLQSVTAPNGTVYSSANSNAASRAASRVLASPASGDDPGWGDDYLHGELQPGDVAGDALVDAWGTPLIYVCQVLPGCQPAADAKPFNGTAVSFVDPDLYGLGASGRTPLVAYDGSKQSALAADPQHLPDPANRAHSDIRTHAAPAYALEFELWSAGPRRDFAWMRDDPANSDNLAPRAYNLALR